MSQKLRVQVSASSLDVIVDKCGPSGPPGNQVWDHRLIDVPQPILSIMLDRLRSEQEKLREGWDQGGSVGERSGGEGPGKEQLLAPAELFLKLVPW